MPSETDNKKKYDGRYTKSKKKNRKRLKTASQSLGQTGESSNNGKDEELGSIEAIAALYLLVETLKSSHSYFTSFIKTAPTVALAGIVHGFLQDSKSSNNSKSEKGEKATEDLTQDEIQMAAQLDGALDKVEEKNPGFFEEVQKKIDKRFEELKEMAEKHSDSEKLDEAFLMSPKYNAACIKRMLAAELARSGQYGNLDGINQVLAASIAVSGVFEESLMNVSTEIGRFLSSVNKQASQNPENTGYIRSASTYLTHGAQAAAALSPLMYSAYVVGKTVAGGILKAPSAGLIVMGSGVMQGVYNVAKSKDESYDKLAKTYNDHMMMSWGQFALSIRKGMYGYTESVRSDYNKAFEKSLDKSCKHRKSVSEGVGSYLRDKPHLAAKASEEILRAHAMNNSGYVGLATMYFADVVAASIKAFGAVTSKELHSAARVAGAVSASVISNKLRSGGDNGQSR